MNPDLETPLLGGLTPRAFLAEYWQKKPLLIRRALPRFTSPVTPEELAGLACEEEVESRLVLERGGASPWQLRHGPFDAGDFTTLPETHWTLLVQEVQKLVPAAADLLERFRFIPDWRVDDIMVSYSPTHGSVGPHVDSYDVFLLQAQGRKRWAIAADFEHVLLPDLGLGILARFQAEREWVLEPGDMLYLPPGVAHHGVALEDCQTWSVGLRAPSHADLVTALAEHLAEHLGPDARYADPDLAPQDNPGAITPAALERVAAIVRDAVDSADLAEVFGGLVTENRSGLGPAPAEREIDTAEFYQRLGRAGGLRRVDGVRFAYSEGIGRSPDRLFVDGRSWLLGPDLAGVAALLCRDRQIALRSLDAWMGGPGLGDVLAQLYNQGYVTFDANQGEESPHDATPARSGAYRIVRARWPEDEAAIRRVREAVFMREQGVPLALEWDGLDPGYAQLLALDRGGRPIGTGRMSPAGHIGRMAVLPDWRGRGVGGALLAKLLDLARGDGLATVYLHAQTRAAPFYAGHGFRPVGEEFLDAGIAHLKMVQNLETGA